MEKRTILALVMVAIVIVITPKLFPGKPPQTPVDATKAASNKSGELPHVENPRQDQLRTRIDSVRPAEQLAEVDGDSSGFAIQNSTTAFEFGSRGAVLERVVLKTYRNLSRSTDPFVEIAGERAPLLSYLLVTARDTIDLRTVTFSRSVEASHPDQVVYRGLVRGARIELRYNVTPDSFLVRVSGQITTSDSLGEVRAVLVELPNSLQSYEADTVDDQHHLAFAYRTKGGDTQSIAFAKLDPGERQLIAGPLTWVVAKNKYFLAGVLSSGSDSSSIAEFSATGGVRASKTATIAHGTLVYRAIGGQFAFDFYAGPQQWQRLATLGREFENSNPYGGFLQPVVQPFATIVMKILLWMRQSFQISYGWVLVIFGIAVRLILWPLNQKGMRASMKMQRIQPELNELQKRYKGDPQKLQTEMMRVYKEHDMSPFSTFAGCLPLFLPLPVLFALFFVFQNTIEFRGVPFLWFPDISQKDPIYIVPLTMGVSMFVLSWIGMRNTPPNPQTKAMTYIFPVMMTVLFANFAAGLNMYYTIQNLAAIPQQWLIANERAKQTGATGPKT